MRMRFPIALFAFLVPITIMAQNREIRASWVVDGAKEKNEYRSHVTLECLEAGASVVYATNGAQLVLTRIHLNKTSGSLADPDRRKTGINSAVLADGGSKVTVEYCDVMLHTAQADGLTASGEGTRIIVEDGTITANRGASAAVCAINGGEAVVNKTDIKTYSNQSPAFYAYNGGRVNVTEVNGENAGQGSPVFLSQGEIFASKCILKSDKWTIGSVDDGRLQLTDNELTAGGVSGFLIYGATSNEVKSSLTLTKNKITVAEGPLFLVTNVNEADITVSGNKISSKSKELMSVRSDDWGLKGKNGGHAVLNVEKQSLTGEINVDSISSVLVNLRKGGKLNGSINKVENRCAQVRVKLGAGSTWTAKGDCYLTSVEFDQPLAKGLKQLKGNHTIYYDPSDPANAPLEGKEHKTGGGRLCPLK